VPDAKPPFKYCPSCGEGVYTYTVQKETGVELRCSSCGLSLSLEANAPLKALDCIMITDDDRFFRTLLAELLNERRLTTNVISSESGTSFLAQAAERISQKLPIKLVILDIMMEPIDGIATAFAFRALEKGLKVPTPTPVLFLSAARSDENLKRQVGRCQPALYLNKGLDATPDRLGPRLEKVIAYLLELGRGSTHG